MTLTAPHKSSPSTGQDRSETSRGDLHGGSLPTTGTNRGEFLESTRSSSGVISELYGNGHLSPASGLHSLSPSERREINQIINEINSSRLPVDVRKEIIKQLVRDLTNPEEISQGMHATCVSSSAQTQLLAIERPALYARMIADLAVKGEATFNDPARSTVKLDSAALSSDSMVVREPYQPRTITERMMQDVLVKYAIGQTVQAGTSAPLTYDVVTDTISGTYQNQTTSYRGLFNDQIARLHQGITGMKCDAVYADTDPRKAEQTIQAQLESGKGPLILMNWDTSGIHQLHAVIVKGIDHEKGIVTLYNPHGATNPPPVEGAIQTISLESFRSRLQCVFVDTNRKNDGVVSIRVDSFEAIEREASRSDTYRKMEPLQLQITPPTESAETSISTNTPNGSKAPRFTVIGLEELDAILKRRERQELSNAAAASQLNGKPRSNESQGPSSAPIRPKKNDDSAND